MDKFVFFVVYILGFLVSVSPAFDKDRYGSESVSSKLIVLCIAIVWPAWWTLLVMYRVFYFLVDNE